MLASQEDLFGCDTLVATATGTADRSVIFAKNSDRLSDEYQHLQVSPSGTWDTHGDNIPPYGGIKKGLGPLLPLFDHLITTLVDDLDSRGMLDHVLVLAMGEFGRTPTMGTQGSTDGRDHWPVVMSMALAGGGLRHSQVIGATEKDGGTIKERPVTPGDLAATIYYHMGVPLDTTYVDTSGRPRFIVANGQPMHELI